ncbi:MAG: pyridoxamine 5'-phosphate oxidase family protein, partial [Pseudomonadota bacterium]
MSETKDSADEAGVFTSEDPIALFHEWMELAREKEPEDPNAMALATADANGFPDVRMVLLKGADADGFVFYTNLESA